MLDLRMTLKEIDLQVMINDFFNLLYKYQIRLPGSLTMFFKALAILEGVITSLDLDQNILEMAQPIARKLLKNFISKDYLTATVFPAIYDSGVIAVGAFSGGTFVLASPTRQVPRKVGGIIAELNLGPLWLS